MFLIDDNEIFLEADEGNEGADTPPVADNGEHGETASESDFQLDDDLTNENDDSSDETENTDDGIPDDMGSDMEGDEGGDDMSSQDNSSFSDDMEGNAGTPEDVKKFVLFNQYKELYILIDNLLNSLEIFFSTYNIETDSEEYKLYNDIKKLKEDMTFVFLNKFENDNYNNLLKLYFYFKKLLEEYFELTNNFITKNKQ